MVILIARIWIYSSILLGVCCSASQDTIGTFWHISDHHYDPYYSRLEKNASNVCPSSEGLPVSDPGPYGALRCDSPWKLVNSSVFAMKQHESHPDFIIWTGDDALHILDGDKRLDQEKLVEIVGNITNLLKTVFPEAKVYGTLGNHDCFPPNVMVPGKNTLLSSIALLWKEWMTPHAYESFRNHGYYSGNVGIKSKLRIMSLNTNLWSLRNTFVDGTGDPGGQLEWMKKTLVKSRRLSQKVFIIGHIPPGYSEKTDNVHWFYPLYNERLLFLMTSFSDIISAHFFGHHHSDTFRILKDENGKAVSPMFLAGGITPMNWPGNQNPAIKLFEYSRESVILKDYVQYHLDLKEANEGHAEWRMEYRATEDYSIKNISIESLANLTENTKRDCENYNCPPVFDKIFLHLSSSMNRSKCKKDCQRKLLCAMSELAIESHQKCISDWSSHTKNISTKRIGIITWVIIICILVFLTASLVYGCIRIERKKLQYATSYRYDYSHL